MKLQFTGTVKEFRDYLASLSEIDGDISASIETRKEVPPSVILEVKDMPSEVEVLVSYMRNRAMSHGATGVIKARRELTHETLGQAADWVNSNLDALKAAGLRVP